MIGNPAVVGPEESLPGLRKDARAMKEKPPSLVRVSAIFAGGNLVATVLRLLAGILTSRAVDPSILGLFNGIGLVRGYAPFLQAGVSNGLNRELPYFVGKGDRKQAEALAATAQAWVFLVSSGAVLILFGVAGWNVVHGRYELALGWALFIFPVIGVLFGDFYLRVLYATHGQFPRLSFITVLVAGASVVTVALVWWLGFTGLCLRVALIAVLMLGLLWHWCPLRIRPRWRWQDLRLLFATGIPIFAVGQLAAWWSVLDSTLVLAYAGTQGLGLYALANMAGPTVALLPQAMSNVVYPRMSEEYGKTERVGPLVRMVAMPTLLTTAVTGVVVVVGWVLTPPVVRFILPKYVEGIPAAQWSIVAISALALSPVNNIFNVVKKQGRYGLAILTGMGIYFITLKWLIRDGVSLEAFPQAMAAGRFAFVVVCYVLIAWMAWAEKLGDHGARD